jgi:hypothetical protein
MAHTKSTKKERVTVSLSRDAARFLRSFRDQVKAPSVSALLESILANLKGAHEMDQLNARVNAYYDSLSDSDVREDAAWGQFGESALLETEIESDRPGLARVQR